MRPNISTRELLKITRFCICEGRIGCFILAMGTVLRHRQTCWIRYHLPPSAASGDHCCKLIKMLSLAEKPSWEIKKISAIFFLFLPGTAQWIGVCKETGLTWVFLRSSVPSKLTAFFKSWLGLVYHCTVPMCNILFVVMGALLQVQCQEHHLLCSASSVARETGRVALQVTIALQGLGGWTGREQEWDSREFWSW